MAKAKSLNPFVPALVLEILPHRNRVIQERIEMTQRVNKLEAFLIGEESSKVPAVEKDLLSQQLEHMALYLQVLDARVALFTGAKRYTCHKEVLARPMTRLAYNAIRGWELPANENGADEGYLVEYLGAGEPNHKDFAGYISWSPKSVFENGYKEAA